MGTPTTKALTPAQLGNLARALPQRLQGEGVSIRQCMVTMDETASEGKATVMCALDNNTNKADGWIKAVFTGNYADTRFVSADDVLQLQLVNVPSGAVPNRTYVERIYAARAGKATDVVKGEDLALANAIGLQFPPKVVVVEKEKTVAGGVVTLTPRGTSFRQGGDVTVFTAKSTEDKTLTVQVTGPDGYSSSKTIELKKADASAIGFVIAAADVDKLKPGNYNINVLVPGEVAPQSFPFELKPAVATLSGFGVTRNRDGSYTVAFASDKPAALTVTVGSVSKNLKVDAAGSFQINLTAAEVKSLGRGSHTVEFSVADGATYNAGKITVKGNPPPPPPPPGPIFTGPKKGK